MGKARPFYGEYAWAYDSLLARPASTNCEFIADVLAGCGVRAGAHILDAGCGTGGYLLELARLGYTVSGLDLSAELLAEARVRLKGAGLPASLVRGDILAMPFAASHDAILCRGVLNDLLDAEGRRNAFASFAGVLRRGGVLVLDVREWDGTARRKTLEPLFETCIDTPRGRLTFRSLTRLDPENRQLLVSERHTLRKEGQVNVSLHDFVMRCWTRDELQDNLTRAGFDEIVYLGGYDHDCPPGSSDRLVCVASA